jgi:glycosyltransferase involved in cell wall biosynthesis
VLAALVLMLRPLLSYRLIIDAHNEAVEPFLHRSPPMLVITRWLLRRADRVIVTNHQLSEAVTRSKGRPLVLTDPIPVAPPTRARVASERFRVAVISTYADDEPFEEIVAAAVAAGSEFQFSVTGNPKMLAESVRRSLPPNVTLTGFLSEGDYWHLLASSDAVLDLTTMDSCLVCGAYEAIAAGVPLVLSDNAASLSTFGDFAEFTSNSSHDIVAALRRIQSRQTELLATIPKAREEFETRWSAQAQTLSSLIDSEISGTKHGHPERS